MADFVGYLAEDEGTRAIGLFVETIRRPDAFAAALARAAEAGKPVVCLKVGRSQAAARAALAHSGAVVGSARAFSALLRHHGAIEVGDFHELLETLEVLGRRRWPRGLRIAAVSESGGECGLLADHGEEAGMPFAPFDARARGTADRGVPQLHPAREPARLLGDRRGRARLPGTLTLLRDAGAYDVLLAQLDLSRHRGAHEEEWCALITAALADAVEGTDIFPAVTSVHATDPPPAIAELARARDVALLRGTREGLRAIAAVARWRPARAAAVAGRRRSTGDPLPAGALPEHDSCALLERYGVAFAAARGAARLPPRRRRPASSWAAPSSSRSTARRTSRSAGGVVLGLGSPAEAREAAERLGGRVLVARQVAGGVEAFCGMTRDPDYGPVLAVGLGGRAIEALGLAAVALAPLDDAGARALVAEAPGLAQLASGARPSARRHPGRALAPGARPSRGRRGRRQSAHPRRRRRDRRRRAGRREGSAMSEVVLEQRRGPALWITLNRPDKLNALSGELVDGLRASFRRAAADEEVKVVVLTGAGRAFSAGFDIAEEVEGEIAGAERWHELLATDVALGMGLWALPRADDRRGARLVPGRRLRARDGLRHDRRGRRRPLRRARDPLRLRPGHRC